MGLLKKGLSEQQRLQASLVEKRMEESKERLKQNIEAFRKDYRDLVFKHGIKHIPQITLDRSKGLILFMAEQECKEEVELVKKRQEETVKKAEGDGVIKN